MKSNAHIHTLGTLPLILLAFVFALPFAPLASAAEKVTMADAVSRALRDNPSIASAAAGSKASEEGHKASRGAFGPRLGMTYNVRKTEQETNPKSLVRPAERGTYAMAFEIEQPVFTGFKLLSAYQKSALQADSDKAAVRNAEISLVAQVQSSFLSYLQARENVRSSKVSLTRLRDQLKITQSFYNVGLRPRLDVLQAEVDVSSAESQLIQAENTRDTMQAKLNTLLGLPATAQIEYVGELSRVPFTRGLEACLETAYTQRPDLYMARKAVEIAEKNRTAVQGDYYPQVSGYYNIGQQGNTWDLQRAGNYGSRASTWEVGLQASWTVFSWGTTYFADQQSGFIATRMRHEETSSKLSAGYDVKSKLLSLQDADKRIVVAQKGLTQAQEAYNVALAQYQAQVGTNFDVLNASANLAAAETAFTGAKADYLTALASLYAAMGELHPDLMAP